MISDLMRVKPHGHTGVGQTETKSRGFYSRGGIAFIGVNCIHIYVSMAKLSPIRI